MRGRGRGRGRARGYYGRGRGGSRSEGNGQDATEGMVNEDGSGSGEPRTGGYRGRPYRGRRGGRGRGGSRPRSGGENVEGKVTYATSSLLDPLFGNICHKKNAYSGKRDLF